VQECVRQLPLEPVLFESRSNKSATILPLF
jgi:hypothetical protein